MRTKSKVTTILAALCVLLLDSASYCQSAVNVVVPDDLANTPGNSAGTFPFSGYSGSMRYQEVFAASQFGAIQAAGGYITVISFRGPSLCQQPETQGEPNFQINLSTTSKAPDSLSPIFSQNVGQDDQVVLGPGPFNLFAGCSGAPGSPKVFDSIIVLDHPFFYNPNSGSLLLDIRNLSGPALNPSGFALDAQNARGDSVSSILAFDVNNQAADQIDSSGFIARFTIEPVPEPGTWAMLVVGSAALALFTRYGNNRRKQ